jgi:hypothetical protein
MVHIVTLIGINSITSLTTINTLIPLFLKNPYSKIHSSSRTESEEIRVALLPVVLLHYRPAIQSGSSRSPAENGAAGYFYHRIFETMLHACFTIFYIS